MPLDPSLQKLLNTYDQQNGGSGAATGTHSAAYNSVVASLNASPGLLNDFTVAAQNGTLTGIFSQSPNPNSPTNGAYFSPTDNSHGYMVITPSFLSSAAQSNQNNLIFVLGHELQHLSDDPGVSIAYNSLDQSITNYNSNSANAGKPQNLTNATNSYVTTQLQDEGTANIKGWNDEVSAAVAANGGVALTAQQLANLANNNGQASYGLQFFNLNSTQTIATPKPGYTVNSDGTISPNTANIVQAGIDQGARLQSTTLQPYQQTDVGIALNRFAIDESGNTFAVDYTQLGITASGGNLTLIQNGFRGNATIVDLADNSTNKFTFSGNTANVDVKSSDASGNALDEQRNYSITPNGSGGNTVSLSNDVLTTTSADGKMVSVSTDSNGDGKVDNSDTQTFTDSTRTTLSTDTSVFNNYSAGTSSTTTVNYNPGVVGGQCTFDTKVNQIGSPSVATSDVNGTETPTGSILTAAITGTGATVNANNARINEANAASAALNGSGNTVSSGTNTTVALGANSNNDVVTMGSNGAVSVADGDHGEVINQTGGTVTLGNGTNTTIVGSNVQIGGGTGNTVSVVGNDTVSGTNDYVYLGSNESVTTNGTGLVVETSANDVIFGSGDTVRVGGNGGGNTADTTVVGNNDAIDDLGSKNTLSVVGTNQTVQNDAAGTAIYLGSSTSVTDKGSNNIVNTSAGDAITATGDTVRVGGNGGGNTAVTTVLGGNDVINDLGATNTLAVVGSNQTIQNDAAGTAIYLGAGTSVTDQGTHDVINTAASDAITATGDTVYVGGNGGGNTAVTTVLGGSDIVDDRGTNGTLAVVGSSQTVQNDAAGTAIYLGAGTSLTDKGTNDVINTAASDAITATGDTVYVGGNGGGNTAVTTVLGGSDIVDDRGTNGTLAVVGSSQTVQNDAAGTAIYLGAGTSVTDKGTNDVINTAASDAITATGDTIYVGANGGGNTAVTTVLGGGDYVDDRGTSGTLAIVGNNQTVRNDASGTAIYLANNTSVTDQGTHDIINTAGSDIINATGDTIQVGSNLTAGQSVGNTTVLGNGNTINDGTGNTLSIEGSDTVYGKNDVVYEYNSAGQETDEVHLDAAGDENFDAKFAPGASYSYEIDQFNDSGNEIQADKFNQSSGQLSEVDTWDGTHPYASEEEFSNGGTYFSEIETFNTSTGAQTAGEQFNSQTGAEVDYYSGGSWYAGNQNATDYSDTNYSDTEYEYDGEDPIILNLQGGKVQTTSASGSSAYFDMQNSGQKLQTGWATAGEGMLVFDPNNTGTVTSEANLVAGFEELSTLAGQTGGVLNESNPLWNELKVWVDPTGTANFQKGQLESLDQLGITSINLNSTAEKVNSNGNTILNDSSFTWKNGASGDIAGVDLAFNPVAATNKSIASSILNSGIGATSFGSLNHLIQSMAAFTNDGSGIDPTVPHASANADAFHLAVSQMARHV
ncbi:beta strand repeat-containing protein [Collimonas sp. NPDC087041]|uniref:beta strand repeat-containing protein n=1 Tax=Collimonas sp. NPDC087041 TaxID=3363960 RepID=UPI003828E580